MLKSITFDELIACILVVGCLVLLVLHIDSEVKSILTMAAGWAFGKTYGKLKGGSYGGN